MPVHPSIDRLWWAEGALQDDEDESVVLIDCAEIRQLHFLFIDSTIYNVSQELFIIGNLVACSILQGELGGNEVRFRPWTPFSKEAGGCDFEPRLRLSKLLDLLNLLNIKSDPWYYDVGNRLIKMGLL